MGHANDDLQSMPQRMLRSDHVRQNEAQGPPNNLTIPETYVYQPGSSASRESATGEKTGLQTHHSDCFNAHHEWVRNEISRIRQRVFLPQLPTDILSRSHGRVMGDKVRFEKTMEGSRCIRMVISTRHSSGRGNPRDIYREQTTVWQACRPLTLTGANTWHWRVQGRELPPSPRRSR